MAEFQGPDLNVLGLSVQSLLIVLIVLMLLQCFGILKCTEGMSNVDYDKYQAAFNQEHDNVLGATESGRSLNEKKVDAWSEGLVGGYEAPAFWDGADYNMNQSKGEGNVITTTRPIESKEGMEDPLINILHGGSPE